MGGGPQRMRGRMCGDRSREGTEGRRDKGEGRGAAVGTVSVILKN